MRAIFCLVETLLATKISTLDSGKLPANEAIFTTIFTAKAGTTTLKKKMQFGGNTAHVIVNECSQLRVSFQW